MPCTIKMDRKLTQKKGKNKNKNKKKLDDQPIKMIYSLHT